MALVGIFPEFTIRKVMYVTTATDKNDLVPSRAFYPRQYLRNVEVEKNIYTTNSNIKEQVQYISRLVKSQYLTNS